MTSPNQANPSEGLANNSLTLSPPEAPSSSVDDTNSTISLSTTFFPGADIGKDRSFADVTLCSSDTVFFYVHRNVLTSASSNCFNQLLPEYMQSPGLQVTPISAAAHSPTFPESHIHMNRWGSPNVAYDPYPSEEILPIIITLPEPSTVLNVALHVIYNLSCAKNNPDLQTLSQLFPFMKKYGLSQSELVQPMSEIPRLLLAFAPTNSIEVYTIAAANNLESLAILASQYTLSVYLWIITDQQVLDMGAIYFKRLVFLHMGREEALKRVISAPPEYHFPTSSCSMESQRGVIRAWSLATAFVLQGGQRNSSAQNTPVQGPIQGITAAGLDSIFSPMASSITCPECVTCLKTRVASMLRDWSLVKNTI
ncbi:hypothetical protein FRC03_011707 [Tulasnella sp. 419]|nr:hypothetical protein FRC03_011707 [Tulasnella sp. 419]